LLKSETIPHDKVFFREGAGLEGRDIEHVTIVMGNVRRLPMNRK
jgi:hypothetical protein